MFFLFREKERTKEKSIAFGLFIRRFVWIRTFYWILCWEGAFAFFRRLSRPEPAALAMLAALPLTAHCYLLRFGIPRAGFWLSQMLFTRGVFTAAAAQRVIRGASRAGPYIGAQRGKCPSAAIWLYSHRIIGRARHKPERARQLRRIYRASVRASYTPGERRFPARGGIRHCRTVPRVCLKNSLIRNFGVFCAISASSTLDLALLSLRVSSLN